ncbi:hypothetical protein DPEC_G00345860 [Dallia pectoralis]|uniref:Uncharacterized protein n=1 Tax=Dallia pectoralis TaxID=75939 RepID=A0ACC2F3H4_DALPE|nr:hypothetical protein DPEC_G00345860 [Dallia pectoralis]
MAGIIRAPDCGGYHREHCGRSARAWILGGVVPHVRWKSQDRGVWRRRGSRQQGLRQGVHPRTSSSNPPVWPLLSPCPTSEPGAHTHGSQASRMQCRRDNSTPHPPAKRGYPIKPHPAPQPVNSCTILPARQSLTPPPSSLSTPDLSNYCQ